MKKLVFIIISFVFCELRAQFIFPVHLNYCNTSRFCLDCGDIKAGCDEKQFAKFVKRLNQVLVPYGLAGGIKYQVLINNKGKACVMSHTDTSLNPISIAIADEIRYYRKWEPAITGGKKEISSSVTMVFSILNDTIHGHIERMDKVAFLKGFDHAVDPVIRNKTQRYSNYNLDTYKFTVWNSHNSELSDNFIDHIAIDSQNNIWIRTSEALFQMKGTDILRIKPELLDTNKYINYASLAMMGSTLWTFVYNGGAKLLSYTNGIWTEHPIKGNIKDPGIYKIISDERNNELLFCANYGLVVKTPEYSYTLTQDSIKDFPGNKVYFAKKDSRHRLWIGTFTGSAMIDEFGNLISFKDTGHMLYRCCITDMEEDENGNLYFGLYNYKKDTFSDGQRQEGIAILKQNGDWSRLTTTNSGLPVNSTTSLLYSKMEKVLWITTADCGLVRFDLNNGWELYHNLNSDIPTSMIMTMSIDNLGQLYLGTRQGLVKIEKK